MTLDYFYGQAGELFSFFRIPKALFQEQRFQDLSTDAKTLYGILLDRMSLSVKNEWFDKKGRVFIIFTIEDVKRTLRCADNKATRLLRELEKFGLIERKRRGQGKPCLVYVKNFSAESSKESVKNRDNDDSCGSKIACQDPVKSRGIKKKENKTEMNNTNPILSDESEKMKNRELLEEYFSCSLEIDLLLRLYPDDEDTLYQIVNLLVDTCATNRKLLHIAGDDKPAEVVRSRFMKLNADHMISMGTYYATYILGNQNLFGVFSWAVNIPLIIALVFTPTLVAKWSGMYKLNVLSYSLATVARALVAVAGYMGSGNVPLMLLFTAVAALGQGPWQGDMNAVIAACSEYTWLTKHKRVDGTMYSCTSLGVKLGGGLGTAITGWLLAASHFDSALAVQPESCISMLKIMYLVIPFTLDAVITFILSRMKVEEANAKLRAAA